MSDGRSTPRSSASGPRLSSQPQLLAAIRGLTRLVCRFMLSRSSGGGSAGPGCGPGRELHPARCQGQGGRAMGGDLMAREWDVPGYTEVKVMGSGGFGEVVLARH